MNDRYRSVHGFERSQDWQYDGVVASQADNARMLPVVSIRCWMIEDLPVALLHLFEGVSSIKRSNGYIAAVNLSCIQYLWSGSRQEYTTNLTIDKPSS